MKIFARKKKIGWKADAIKPILKYLIKKTYVKKLKKTKIKIKIKK